jgi:Family of unknown function (DUF6152)
MFTSKVKLLFAASAAALLAGVVPAAAHHAAEVLFSPDKEIVLTGSVKDVQYNNPHAVIQVVVPGAGQPVQWTVLTESPLELAKAGIAKGTLRPGESVTLRVRPAKSGKTTAWLLDITKQDGTVLTVDE